MTKGEIAKAYFKSGYNCSQAVAMAFSEEMGIDAQAAARMTIGFGGGIGRMRQVCGAVCGITFVLSSLYGDEDRGTVYAAVQELSKKFEAENGSIICHKLLGLSAAPADSPVPEKRTKEYYKKRPCADIVESAADILEEYIKNRA